MDQIPIIGHLKQYLSGAPNEVLTVLLLGLSFVIAIVAFSNNPVLKAAVAAWVIVP